MLIPAAENPAVPPEWRAVLLMMLAIALVAAVFMYVGHH
jgi:hypothetical protein